MFKNPLFWAYIDNGDNIDSGDDIDNEGINNGKISMKRRLRFSTLILPKATVEILIFRSAQKKAKSKKKSLSICSSKQTDKRI
jgi:hypothetical protein